MHSEFLKGIKFADFTWAGAGSFGTKVFSDFGAEVVKIESTTRPDNCRLMGPFRDDTAGINRSGFFGSRNTGKKSLTVDLKSAEGKQIIRDLISVSDVVSNNFATGVMERLGFTYEDVRRIKPDIIYLAMPMYGEAGPLAEMPGLGMTICATTGLSGLTGYEDGAPVGPGTHYPDHAANPYHAAFGVASALRYRRLTGRGMQIVLAQVESMFNFAGLPFMEHSLTGQEPERIGNRSRFHAPHNLFRCLGDDRWCAITVLKEEQWTALCQVIGRADLASDPELADAQGRKKRQDEIEAAVTAWTSTREARAVMEELQAAGIPASVVSNACDLMDEDPQLAFRDFWQVVEHPEMIATREHSPPYLLDGERVTLKRAPLIGEHTEQILSDVLGYAPDRIQDLRAKGALD